MSPEFIQPFGVAIDAPRNLDEQIDPKYDGSASLLLYRANADEPLKRVIVRIETLIDEAIYCDSSRTNVVIRGDQHWLELPCGTLPATPCRWQVEVEGFPVRMLVSGRNRR